MRRLLILKRVFIAGSISLLVGWMSNRYLRAPLRVPEAIPATRVASESGSQLPQPPLTVTEMEELPVEILARLQTGSIEEIRTILDRLDGVSSPELIEAMRAVGFRRWLAKDAEGAWRYAQEKANGTKAGERWMKAAVTAWAEQDPHAVAAAIADASFQTRWKEVAESTLLARIVDHDPELALTLAQTHSFGNHLNYSSVFSRIASRDPIKASSLAEALPLVPSSSREYATSAVAQEWARTDGRAALDWFAQFPSHPDVGMILGGIGSAWAEHNTPAVLEHLDSFPKTPRGRGSWLGRVLATCWKHDPEGVQAWLENHELADEEVGRVQRQLVQNLSYVDPEGAATLDAKVSKNGMPSMAWEIGRKWAREDANKALEWATALPRGRERDNALMEAQSELAQQNPMRVLEELPSLAQSQFTDNVPSHRLLSQTLMKALSSRGLEGTQAWLEQLPKVYRRSYWNSFAKQWAPRNPSGVIDFLLSQETERAQVSGIQVAIHQWAQTDPAAAAERVLAFKDIETRNVGAKNVVSVWQRFDPEAAQTWIEQLPDPKMRASLLNPRF